MCSLLLVIVVLVFASYHFPGLTFLVEMLVQSGRYSDAPFLVSMSQLSLHPSAVFASPFTTGLRLKQFSPASVHDSTPEAHDHHNG